MLEYSLIDLFPYLVDHILTVKSLIFAASLTLEYVLPIAFHTAYVVGRNITGLLISGVMEFQSNALVMGSFSSQETKAGYLGCSPVPTRWLSLPFRLRVVWIN